MEKITTIDLLRHGACQGGEIFRGVTDVPLSEAGWQQMHTAVGNMDGWDRVLSSPLQRCRSFAEQHAERLGIPVTVEEHWREIHFGVWEGRKISEVWEDESEMLSGYFNSPGTYTPDGGESIFDARDRLLGGWNAVMKKHQGEHLMLVQHGGTIRILLSCLLNMPITAMSQFDVPYASLTRLKIVHLADGDRPVLVFHNVTAV